MLSLHIDLVLLVVHVLSDENLDLEARNEERREGDLDLGGHFVLEVVLYVFVADSGRVLFLCEIVFEAPDRIVAQSVLGIELPFQAGDLVVNDFERSIKDP